MAIISVPANNLVAGENTLKLWCADLSPGIITSIRVAASEEAGHLKEAFNPDGGLSGLALTEGQITANNSAAASASYIIAGMESDQQLSPSEKATWRQAWIEIDGDYHKAIDFADSLDIDRTALYTAYMTLSMVLVSAGVWQEPAAIFLLSGSEITEAAATYSITYKELSIATTNKVAGDTEAAANAHTEEWSEEGANVTEENVSLDTQYVDGVEVGTVISDISTAKFNAENAENAIAEMESDGKLSAVEKATWRNTWQDMDANYIVIKSHAQALYLSYSALAAAKESLETYLISAGVWSNPDTSYTIVGNALSLKTTTYYSAFQLLIKACSEKEGTNAEAGAKDYTEGWSADGADVTADNNNWSDVVNDDGLKAEDGADVTGSNTANDTDHVGGTPTEEVVTDIFTAKSNASAAMGAIAEMAADGKLSPEEKTIWRRQWPIMESNFIEYDIKANRLGVSLSAATTTGLALYNYLISKGVWDRPTVSDDIISSVFETKAKDYYTSIEKFLEACAVKEAQTAENFTRTWSEDGADVTATKIALGFLNQGELAVLNNLSDDRIVSISGTKIIAGTIMAGSLDARSITAAEMALGTLTVDEIRTNTITADRINTTAHIGGSRLTVAGFGSASVTYTLVIYHNLGRYAMVSFFNTNTNLSIDVMTETYFSVTNPDEGTAIFNYIYM